ncbi:hypothetical protein CDQ92_08210 [Sphingopyxis bauzanensis]|uniref:Uncharacterized protein n=2 Tax=Sphingopyxis bauzanensis TaxID=651663 RepID=A0A246JVG9_9SPHN|nr:hypothetical protein CDQ92_08210 [Sphingopyxis bauzanensis]
MQTVRTIREQLAPQDGIAFANYVIRHHAKSASYCGKPLLDADGKAPATVGDAIDLAVRRDAMEQAALLASQAPKHPLQLAREEWDMLQRDRDIVIDTQTRLRSEFGDGASRRPEWASLVTRSAEIDRKLVAMKPTVFGAER